MSASASTILMPDSQPAWKLWRSLASEKSEMLDSPAQCRDSAKPVIVGLPATACRSLGLILPAADPGLLPAMIESQLERRGIVVETSPSPNFAWHILGQDATHTIVSVDVLASPFPENLAIPHATNYTAALRLVSLPPRDLVLLEEQGNLVLVADYQGKLWHSHVIGTAEMPMEDLARELDIAKLSLESLDGFGVLRGVTLVGPRLAPLISELKSYVSFPLDTASTLETARGVKLEDFPRLLPPVVFEAQAARARRAKVLRVAALSAVLYVLLFIVGWSYLNKLQQQVSVLQGQVAETDQPASEVRNTAAHWNVLEPAIEPKRYPVLQLAEITALMPPSGVVIKRFDTKLNEIEITGDARDLQTATQFLEDLKSNPKLGAFNWSMPVPSVKEKVASFKIQGKLNA
jgi:hypothetical protein